MPPPSPALTRLEAERAARAAAAKSPPPEDSLSELEALKAKFDVLTRGGCGQPGIKTRPV